MNEREAKMYELEFPAPDVASDGVDGPTLIIAMQGYADAGLAVEASADHLLSALEHRPVAVFNNDELIDYRSRRPSVTIDHNIVIDANELKLSMDVLRDSNGTPFLLLSGPEPDLRWDAFSQAVADLVRRFGVRRTICIYAAPMTVPHTRPLIVSAHGNSLDLIKHHFSIDSKVTIPGSASLHIERLLNKNNIDVAGYTAHVPHYLSASAYPLATLKLLEAITTSTNLDFPLKTLEADAQKTALQVEEQVAGSQEIESVVKILEQQYDEELEKYRERNPKALEIAEDDLPDADELGEEFERFLANIDEENGSND